MLMSVEIWSIGQFLTEIFQFRPKLRIPAACELTYNVNLFILTNLMKKGVLKKNK